MDKMSAKIEFVELKNTKSSFFLGDMKISWRKMKHPGGSYAYSFDNSRKKMIFATDTEIEPLDFNFVFSAPKFILEERSVIIIIGVALL